VKGGPALLFPLQRKTRMRNLPHLLLVFLYSKSLRNLQQCFKEENDTFFIACYLPSSLVLIPFFSVRSSMKKTYGSLTVRNPGKQKFS
jgi:hypothetical protein